jgi:CAI-1 autoinducer synthase
MFEENFFMHSACENRPRGAEPDPICMPSFVTQRIDAHHIARVGRLLGGEHMHVWKPVGADSIMLAGNDYLCLAGEPVLVQAQVRVLQASQTQPLISSVFQQVR